MAQHFSQKCTRLPPYSVISQRPTPIFEAYPRHPSFLLFMKKLLILAIGAATLGLGACSHSTCPAYSSAKAKAAPITASTATAIERQ